MGGSGVSGGSSGNNRSGDGGSTTTTRWTGRIAAGYLQAYNPPPLPTSPFGAAGTGSCDNVSSFSSLSGGGTGGAAVSNNSNASESTSLVPVKTTIQRGGKTNNNSFYGTTSDGFDYDNDNTVNGDGDDLELSELKNTYMNLLKGYNRIGQVIVKRRTSISRAYTNLTMAKIRIPQGNGPGDYVQVQNPHIRHQKLWVKIPDDAKGKFFKHPVPVRTLSLVRCVLY